jgi:hypothetical protein
LRLDDSLDLLRADKEPTEAHGIADPRLIDEARVRQPGEITGAEHAIGVDRPFGCRRIFQILDEARRCVDP